MKVKDYNSSVNQRIKGKFIQREVLTCFSYEMDELLKKEIVAYDDIDNLYTDKDVWCENCGLEVDLNEDNQCPDCGKELETLPQEIFEWWIITDWLSKKLRDKGEPILEWGNNCYWGRCCTGQAILLDSVISDITSEMEILEGQKYEWKV